MMGGYWKHQNEILNGVYINFISKQASDREKYDDDVPDVPDIPDNCIYLVDNTGAYLMTSDGKYLVVKGI